MKKLEFKFPFDRFSGLGFYNCYASVYLFLQGATAKNTDYYCQAMDGKECNDCRNCDGSLAAKSETLNNLFVTIAGQWTTRQSWSGEKTKIQKELKDEYGDSGSITDNFADFLIGFTGYEYQKVNKGFKESISASIDAGRPVLAKVIKDESKEGPFRVIKGYDGDVLIEPDYRPAADLKKLTAYDNIEYLYVFGNKIPQKYTFLDVLKIMERAMDSDFADGLWQDFACKFDFEGGRLWETNVSEMRNRFKRLRDVMGWVPNIGHGLQIAFGDRELLKELGMNVGQMRELLDVIGYQTHLLHNRGYMLSAICDSVTAFQMNDTGTWPWDKHGLITAAQQILESIMDCDLQILLAIKKAIRKLS